MASYKWRETVRSRGIKVISHNVCSYPDATPTSHIVTALYSLGLCMISAPTLVQTYMHVHIHVRAFLPKRCSVWLHFGQLLTFYLVQVFSRWR